MTSHTNQTSHNPKVYNHTSHCFDYSKPCVTIIETMRVRKRGARFITWGYYTNVPEAWRIAGGLADGHPDWIVAIKHEYLDQGF